MQKWYVKSLCKCYSYVLKEDIVPALGIYIYHRISGHGQHTHLDTLTVAITVTMDY